MNVSAIFGLIILVVGVFLVGFGVRASKTFSNQMMDTVTGRYTRKTITYLIGGALLVLIGGILLYLGERPLVLN